jgi:hypothetical protein
MRMVYTMVICELVSLWPGEAESGIAPRARFLCSLAVQAVAGAARS